MSGKLMGRVFDTALPRNERDVLLSMADHADDFGCGVRPSIAYIAWKVGISTREVARCVKWLKDNKILEMVTKSGFHKPTEYKIIIDNAPLKPEFVPSGDSYSYSPHAQRNVEKGDTPSPISVEKGDTIQSPIDPEKGDQEREKGDQNVEKGDQNVEKGDSMRSPEPLIKPLKDEPLIEPFVGSVKISVGDLWHSVLGELQLQMTKAVFDTWVRPSRAVSFDDQNNVVIIRAHSPYAKEWLEARLSTTVQRTISGIVGKTVAVRYVDK